MKISAGQQGVTRNFDPGHKQKRFTKKAANSESSMKRFEGDVKVDIKPRERFSISENNPDNPQVSTKVLDSLNSNMINFSQEERDTIAKILGGRAQKVIEGRNAAKNS